MVEQTLVDLLLWYRAEVKDIRDKHTGCPLSEAQLCKRVRDAFTDRGLAAPSKQTIAKHMKIALHFTDLGLEAMMDVTYLNGRPPRHQDHQLFDHKKLTKKMLERPEFLKMTSHEQEVYVFRIARGHCPNQIYTTDELDTLDAIVSAVSKEMARVEKIAPREEWSPMFKSLMRRYLVKESPAKFKMHTAALHKQVDAYVKDLETGMTPSEDRKKMLLSQPHPHTCTAMQNEVMSTLWDAYVAKKKVSDEKVASDKKKFLDDAKRDPTKKAAIEAGTAAKKAGAVAKEASDKAKTLTGKASEAAAAVSPTAAGAAAGAAGGAPVAAGDSSSSSAPEPTTSKTATAQPAAKESTTSGDDGKIPTGYAFLSSAAKRKGTPSVRTLSKAPAKTEQWAKLRKEVTTVQSVDIFSSDFDSTTRPLEVDRDSAMLVFVNLGADPGLLDGTDEATERLHAGLVALESVLHPRGTVVIAMGSIANFDFPYMEARLKAADLAMEKNPVVSIYLEGQPGRIPEGLKNHLTTQGCSVLVAHKTNDFACHGHPVGKRRAARGAASSASFKSPRQAHFEAVGFVVSDKHPSTATFLSTSTADHLINRFTVPGDCVLVTTFEENPLASLVLGQGRHLGALVADSTKAENAEVEVNEACVTATKHGWFAELNKTKVLMTGSTLPSCIPSSNLSAHAAKQYESQRATDDEEDTDGDVLRALDVARELAGAMELEIKDSSHGLGLFATKDIEFGDSVPMTAMGAYEILTLDEMIAEVNSDGDPRYPVLEYDNLVALLGDDEIVREGSKLWLRPTRESPLFYVNSSFPDAHLQNLLRESKLDENPPASADEAKKVLVEAAKGVSFRVSRTVRAGEELLIHYPVAPENSGDSSGEDGTGSQGREKRQRRSSRSSAEKPTYVESASDDDDAMEGWGDVVRSRVAC